MNVRRVVTGHDPNGTAIFASDELVPPLTMTLRPGWEFHRLWGADAPPTFPDDGSPTPQPTYFPPLGGYRFAIFTVPPRSQASPEPDSEAGLAEIEAKLPGLQSYMEADHPGMHTTDTIDFEVVLAGQLILELDAGATVLLKPGDTVVQNGTRHRWRNEWDDPAVVAVVLIGAARR